MARRARLIVARVDPQYIPDISPLTSDSCSHHIMRDTKDSHARHRPGYTKAALSRRKRHEKHKPQHPLSLDFEGAFQLK